MRYHARRDRNVRQVITVVHRQVPIRRVDIQQLIIVSRVTPTLKWYQERERGPVLHLGYGPAANEGSEAVDGLLSNKA